MYRFQNLELKYTVHQLSSVSSIRAANYTMNVDIDYVFKKYQTIDTVQY